MKSLFFKNNKTLTVTTTALFIALGIIFPLVFHAVGLGSTFSPMHIPVILCGLICGATAGAIVGFVTPFLSSLLNGMPPIYPTAVAMSLELAAYGFVAGLVLALLENKSPDGFFKKSRYVWSVVVCWIPARLLFGLAMWIMLAASGQEYTFAMFVTATVLKAWPALVLQIIAIPLIMFTLQKANVLQKYEQTY